MTWFQKPLERAGSLSGDSENSTSCALSPARLTARAPLHCTMYTLWLGSCLRPCRYSNISRLEIHGMKLPPFPSKFVKATSPQIVQVRTAPPMIARSVQYVRTTGSPTSVGANFECGTGSACPLHSPAIAFNQRCKFQEPEVLEHQQSPILSFLGKLFKHKCCCIFHP